MFQGLISKSFSQFYFSSNFGLFISQLRDMKTLSSTLGTLTNDTDNKLRPSQTFLSKERAPYSYIQHKNVPDLGLYRPKFVAVDATKPKTVFNARQKFSQTDIRYSFKPIPACQVIGEGNCTFYSRRHIRNASKQQSSNRSKKRPATAQPFSSVAGKQ